MTKEQTKIILILKYGSMKEAAKEWLYCVTFGKPLDMTNAEYILAKKYAHKHLINMNP